MSVREFLASVFDNQLAWALGSVFGLGAAFVDLRSGTRWPYLVAVCAIALLLTLLQPRWAWRWTLLAALVLPAFVLLSGEWGPYRMDQFDVFYGVLPAGLGAVLGLVLRKAASSRRQPPLQTTALVHEAYLHLMDAKSAGWRDRAHFFAASAQIMRRILIDTARARTSQKRGGGFERINHSTGVNLDQIPALVSGRSAELLSLDDALMRLEQMDARKARVIELRFFGGLSVEEAADLIVSLGRGMIPSPAILTVVEHATHAAVTLLYIPALSRRLRIERADQFCLRAKGSPRFCVWRWLVA